MAHDFDKYRGSVDPVRLERRIRGAMSSGCNRMELSTQEMAELLLAIQERNDYRDRLDLEADQYREIRRSTKDASLVAIATSHESAIRNMLDGKPAERMATIIDFEPEAQKLVDADRESMNSWREGYRRLATSAPGEEFLVQWKVSPFNYDQIEQFLQGTCNSEDEVAAAFDIPAEAVLEVLPSLDIERCETCGWWCERSEMELVGVEETCEDCRADEEE